MNTLLPTPKFWLLFLLQGDTQPGQQWDPDGTGSCTCCFLLPHTTSKMFFQTRELEILLMGNLS